MATVKEIFAPVVALVESQAGSNKNWKKIRLTISWYYDLVKAKVTLEKAEWQEIIEGGQFVKAGGGFMGEDGPHQDYWLFNYKGPGPLEVEYEDDAQGFLGDLEDALIEVV